MYFDRLALKAEARQAMRSTRPRPMLVTLLYLLLTTGLSTLASIIITDPIVLFTQLTEQGLNPGNALLVALSDIGPVGLFLHLMVALFGTVLSFGYSRWALNSSRGEKASVSDLVHGFSIVGKVLGLNILIAVYSLLWALFLLMAGQLILLVIIWIPLLNIPAAFALFFCGVAFYLTRVLRYSMAFYCLLDDPALSVFQALRHSVLLMQGQVKHFFFLQLSFIGWYLLSALVGIVASAAYLSIPMGGGIVAGIILLSSLPLDMWLRIYTTFTWCRFYDRLPHTQSHTSPFEL